MVGTLAVATSALAEVAKPLLTWSTPQTVATGAITDVDCPTAAFCVAVDQDGDAISSTEPMGPSSSWQEVNVVDSTLRGVSCVSPTFCVGVGADGKVVISTDPAAGEWTTTVLSGIGEIDAVDCTAGLCAAIDANGEIITSTDPTGGPSAWTVANIKGSSSLSLSAIDCASAELCLAVGSQFNSLGGGFSVKQNVAVSATDPSGGVGSWTKAFLSFNSDMRAISCPSTSFCLIVDQWGEAWSTSNPTGGETAWSKSLIDDEEHLSDLSCPVSTFCAAIDETNRALTSAAPSGNREAWGVSSIPAGLLRISCPSTELCVAAGQAQIAIGMPPAPELPAQTAGPTTPGFRPPGWIMFQTGGLWVKNKKARMILSCVGRDVCDGRVKLEAATDPDHSMSVPIGFTRFSIRGKKVVPVVLNEAGRRLFERKRKTKVGILLTEQLPSGQALSRKGSVMFKVPISAWRR
ncbi:MAG TPA: hypothetical protein VF093_10455 [Solirubrobacterales bacterium]